MPSLRAPDGDGVQILPRLSSASSIALGEQKPPATHLVMELFLQARLALFQSSLSASSSP